MKEHPKDRAKHRALQAVETLARSVVPPPPPRVMRPGARLRQFALAAAAVIVLALGGWWLSHESPPTPEVGPTVVVEYLRVAGQPVETQVEELPEAGAVMVTPVSPVSPASNVRTPVPGGDQDPS